MNIVGAWECGAMKVDNQGWYCGWDVKLEGGVFWWIGCIDCNKGCEFEGDATNSSMSYKPKKWVTILLGFSFWFAIGAGITYDETSTANSEYEKCDNCSWEETIGEGIGQGIAEGLGKSAGFAIAQMCLTLSGVLLLFAIVTYAIQQTKRSR